MKERFEKLIARWEPVVSKFQIQAAVAAILLLATSGLVLASGGSDGTGVTTAEPDETSESPLEELTPEEAAVPGSEADTAAPGAAATQAGAKKTVVRKGSVSVTTSPGGVPVANLFTDAEDRIGITDNKITLCGHAALTFAEIFDTRIEDLNVYWSWLKDQGGVHGRNVEMTWEDDAYRSDRAVEAATACKRKNPFILLGGIGFDQIPAVRNFAEENRMPYIHHIAREDLSKKFSWSYLATVERVGEMAAEWILATHSGKKIGIVYRQSENWDPGRKSFVEKLASKGIKPVADLPVSNGQSLYTAQINELRSKGAEVVFIWENALAATEIVKQSEPGYRPQWLMFPFNLTTDALGSDAYKSPTLQGISTWPAYTRGVYSGPFAPYAEEMKTFEAAQAKYGKGQANDILWMTWLGMKQIHKLFEDCGRDCIRNKIAGLLLTNSHQAISSGCPVDFSKNGHVGGFSVSIFEAWNHGGSAAWREIQACKTAF